MADLRKDPVSGRWVIIAEDRAKRPVEFERAPVRRVQSRCPFCVGNEHDTPAEIKNYRLADTGDAAPWHVRVVPNKYPAVNGQGNPFHQSVGMYETMPPVGAHEVIIESAQHRSSITDLTDEQSGLVYSVYRDRLSDLATHSNLAYAMVFKNAGAAAGASLEHLHSQLIATPVVPTDAQIELQNMLDFHRREGKCILCEILLHELAVDKRIIAQTPHFVALCPFASRFAYETWILPRQHSGRFERSADNELDELSQLVRELVGKLESLLQRPAYNWLLRTAPFDTFSQEQYHWHIEIFPRLSEVAGFELGTGCYINAVPPEKAAAILRAKVPRVRD